MWIYVIRNTINGKLYVGQTERSDPSERWKEHLECVQGTRRQRLYASMRCHGIENFEFIPLEEQASFQDLDDAEQFWIEFFRSWDEAFGYNKTKGGQWGRLTPDKIKHLSEINSGEKNPFYGKHHSDEAKIAIGKASKQRLHDHHPTRGRPLSIEHKQKQSHAMKQRWADPTYKERLREKHRNIQRFVPRSKLNEDDVKDVIQRLSQGELAKDIALSFGVSPSTITRIRQGKYISCVIKLL
jgi:group I intron endonuclease